METENNEFPLPEEDENLKVAAPKDDPSLLTENEKAELRNQIDEARALFRRKLGIED